MTTFRGTITEVHSEDANKHWLRYDEADSAFPAKNSVLIDGRINPRMLDSFLGGKVIITTNGQNYITKVDVIPPRSKTRVPIVRRTQPDSRPS